MSKPILLTHKYPDGKVFTLVWHPFHCKKPNLEKAKAQGKLIETDKYFNIVNDFSKEEEE